MSHAEYLHVFIDESREHIQRMNEHLLQLEKNPKVLPVIQEIFRSAHTLKGMAATMGYDDLATLTHSLENVLDMLRNEDLVVTPEIMDIIFTALDHLEEIIWAIAEGGDGRKDVRASVQALESISAGLDEAEQQTAAVGLAVEQEYDEFERAVISQSVDQGFTPYEITITLDETTLLKAARVYMVFNVLENHGEMIKSTPSVDELEDENFDLSFVIAFLSKKNVAELEQVIFSVSEITSVHIQSIKDSFTDSETANVEKPQAATEDLFQPRERSKTIRVNIERMDALMNLFEELIIDRARLEKISQELEHPPLNETVERMNRISGDLQDIILNMRMMPVENVFNRFPRMVRKLSKELGKQVDIEIFGAETELDRTIIDEIGDPLVHLLRNAIDHGIESPDVRVSNGKKRAGTIRLNAYHSGNHVYIEVRDDGAGIAQEAIINKALKQEIVTEAEISKMSEQQIYGLLFSAGFSTADAITDISGRGVGLDVVRQTFESLGGVVSVDAEKDKGSIFSIRLPLTLSIMNVLLVQLQSEHYAIPISAILETAIVPKTDVYTAHHQKVIDFRGQVLPLMFLSDVFHVPHSHGPTEDELYSLVIVQKGKKQVALVVDALIGQQEVVLKSLSHYLTDVYAISGATILGDGDVVLIIDANALLQ